MSKAWMPLYVGNYLGDTSHLTQGQHGAYFLLIMHYWQRESLPGENEQCYSIARAIDKQSRSNVDSILREFFKLSGDFYRHKRIDLELLKVKASYERRAEAGRMRWIKAQAKQEQCISNPSDCDSSSYVEVDSKENIDGQILEIAALHPKVRDAFNLPQDTAVAIAEAIARDGRDVVWAGTKAFAEAVAQWAPSEKQFITAPARFYRQSEYRADPREWERSANGSGKATSKPSASASRSERSKANILDGLAKDIGRRDAHLQPELKSGSGK